MTRAGPAAWAVAVAVAACGGSQDRQPAEDRPADAPRADDAADADRRRALAALRGRQIAACDVMCPRLARCAVESAREHEPDELEGVDEDALARYYADKKCLGPCYESELSPRQVETLEGCNEAGGSCDAYQDCLDAVQPKPSPATDP